MFQRTLSKCILDTIDRQLEVHFDQEYGYGVDNKTTTVFRVSCSYWFPIKSLCVPPFQYQDCHDSTQGSSAILNFTLFGTNDVDMYASSGSTKTHLAYLAICVLSVLCFWPDSGLYPFAKADVVEF